MMTNQEIYEWILSLEKENISRNMLAKKAGFTGDNPAGFINNFINKRGKGNDAGLKHSTLMRLLKAYKDIQEELAAAENTVNNVRFINESGSNKLKTMVRRPPSPPQTGDSIFPLNDYDLIPLYAPIPGADQSIVRFSKEYKLEDIEPNRKLRRVKDGFAMWVYDDSMDPRHEHGEIVYLHPINPPSIGKDCVYIEEITGNAVLRRFLGETNAEWKFLQFNPVKELMIEKSKVQNIFAVVR